MTFVQFISVGAIGAIVDTAVLVALTGLFGVSGFTAKLAGIEAAVVVMFVLNEQWTFTNQGTGGLVAFLRRLGKSHLVRSGGVVVQLIAFWLLLGVPLIQQTVAGVDLWLLVASLVSIAVALIVNYVFEGLYTWQLEQPSETTNGGAETAD